MAARKLDPGYVENLWTMFKTIDDKHVVSSDDYSKLESSGINIPKDSAQLTLRIYAKAARSCPTSQEFSKILESNEFPPMKLTQKEMEFVKGGFKAISSKFSASASAAQMRDSGASSGSCHGESNTSGRSSGSCHGESSYSQS
jgi:hypothetical protein